MFVSFKEGNKTYHSHTSLVPEETAQKIKELYDYIPRLQKGAAFLSFYGMMEAVNRVPKFVNYDFKRRAALVIVPVFAIRYISAALYNRFSIQPQLKTLMIGAPIFETKFDVPELDKLFFFLDDDQNYRPSLHHHGIQSLPKPKMLYQPEIKQ